MDNYSQKILQFILDEIPFLPIGNIPQGFKDTINKLAQKGKFSLNRERINILISYWNLPPMNKNFYSYYFNQAASEIDLNNFKKGMIKFIKDSLWHFGDIKRAFIELSSCEDIKNFINRTNFLSKSFSIAYFGI